MLLPKILSGRGATPKSGPQDECRFLLYSPVGLFNVSFLILLLRILS